MSKHETRMTDAWKREWQPSEIRKAGIPERWGKPWSPAERSCVAPTGSGALIEAYSALDKVRKT